MSAQGPLLADIPIAESATVHTDVKADPAVAKKLKKVMGYVPEWTDAVATVPWLADQMVEGAEVRGARVNFELSERILLVVSQDSSCRHCYGVTRAMLKVLGLSEARIRELETDLHAADVTPTDKLTLDFARKIARSNPRPGNAEAASMRAQELDELFIAEVAASAASAVVACRFMTLIGAEPNPVERMVDGTFGFIMRPIMRMATKKLNKLAPEAALSDSQRRGPFAGVINALDGSPFGPFFRSVIDRMLASEVLPRRAKLLVFAVIARLLGCGAVESEAIDLLVADGMAREVVERILEQLRGDELTEIEAQLVVAARDTVRPSPRVIQDRVRKLNGSIGCAPTDEFIGVASLANALSRLSCLLSIEPAN